MKRTLKTLISIVLCFALLFSATACAYVDEIAGAIDGFISSNDVPENNEEDNKIPPIPNQENKNVFRYKPAPQPNIVVPSDQKRKYTGGFGFDPHAFYPVDYYWFETYDELLEAIARLEAHGSDIYCNLGFDCDGDPYDIKWCLQYKLPVDCTDSDNFFDQKMSGSIVCAIFREEVTIEELIFSYVDKYDCWNADNEKSIHYIKIEDREKLSISWWGKEEVGLEVPPSPVYYYVLYDGVHVATIYASDYSAADYLSDEYLEHLLDTLFLPLPYTPDEVSE